MRPPKNFNAQMALSLVGIDPYALERLLAETPAQERTEVYKKAIKDARRAKLRRVHPDLFQDEQEREKALQITKAVNEAADALLLLRPQERRPSTHYVRVQVDQPFSFYTSTTSAATGGFGHSASVRVYWRR